MNNEIKGCLQKKINAGKIGACPVAVCFIGDPSLQGENCYFDSLRGGSRFVPYDGSNKFTDAYEDIYNIDRSKAPSPENIGLYKIPSNEDYAQVQLDFCEQPDQPSVPAPPSLFD